MTCNECVMFSSGYCKVFMDEVGGNTKACSDFSPKVPKKLRVEDLIWSELLRPKKRV